MINNFDKISLAIKNTNWCNLKCAHCSECSGPNVAPNIMPLSKVEQYIGEFNAMPLPKWEYVVFTGGEAMAPYFHNQMEYIPKCLDIAVSHNMAPFVKTNGTWGANETLRNRILRDFATAAYRSNTLMSVDISVDAFHNNNVAVCNIINDVVRSDYLAPAVRVGLAGLNDMKSRVAFAYLIDNLRASGLTVEVRKDGVFAVGVPHVRRVYVYYDLWTNIGNMGRAVENKLGAFMPDGQPDMVSGHCFQIDNDDVAKLNYVHSVPVNGRQVYNVLKELMSKVR